MAERGTYTSIPRALLAGKDFRALPERARWIFFVLKMNVSAAGIDIWYPDELAARISSESGASLDQVRLTLDILEHENWIRREENVLWVVGHITHDPHLKPSDAKHRKNTQRHVAGLPRMALVRAFIKALPEWFPKSECASMGLAWAFEGPPKGHRRALEGPSKQEKKREDTEKDKNVPAGAVSWPAEGSEWASERIAVISVKQFGGMFKETVDRHGWVETFAGLKLWEEATRGKSRNISFFLKDSVYWIELAKQPTVDPVTRQLTEKGRLALA